MKWSWIAENSARLTELALAHLNLAWPPILAAFLLALPLGWAAHRYARLREMLIGASSVLYLIPSLALFILLPLVLGTSVLSPVNVLVAMTLYGLALQVRSTADAFDTVPEPVRNSAVAMGYAPLQRILAVELPLAGPGILAGLRVVAASTISLISVGALVGVHSLGTLFTEGFQRNFPTEIIAGLLGTVVLALLVDVLLIILGRLLMPWARRVKARS
ncbi:ABC transporter permease [Corynebacterium sp.]|uniref:ABC transporter permease n=1 Tax=Corynebacterium sp. TaxID=1720 RepID=UPI0026DB2735|nr:ABC transporter permease subunit [Corynebacterium sp.]MDO5032747.1 ABC transporter permease subunit [Corynebacterium sp.]